MSTDNTLFGTMTIDPNKDYTNELVGDGKKFKTTADLARGKVESDLFIRQQQTELDELRAELARRKSVEDAIAALSSTTNTPASSPNGAGAPAGASVEPVALDEETLKQRIRATVSETIQAEQTSAMQARNLETVKTTLRAAWGEDFSSKLSSVAAELGATPEYLTDVAKTQPKVFLKLVGADVRQTEQAPSLFSPSSAGVSTAALSSSNRSNLPEQERYSYWKKVRNENPSFYHSPAAAQARFAAAKKHGDAFYAN